MKMTVISNICKIIWENENLLVRDCFISLKSAVSDGHILTVLRSRALFHVVEISHILSKTKISYLLYLLKVDDY